MIVRSLFLILFILTINKSALFAQDFGKISLELADRDISALTNKRLDQNNLNCSILKVYVADNITGVKGHTIGDIIENGLEKIIYVPSDSKFIELQFLNHNPLKIVYEDFINSSLTGGATYILKIKSPEGLEEFGRPSLEIDPKDNYAFDNSIIDDEARVCAV